MLAARVTTPIAVLGAGLQGASVALALAARGRQVRLLERRAAPLLAASRGNEGKIHLGFVYAIDRSGATGRRMLEGALSFAPLLERWCGPLPWETWRSEGFVYAVMPDSIENADGLEEAYARLKDAFPDIARSFRFAPHYIGRPLDWFFRRGHGPRGRPAVNGIPVTNVFDTEEVSVDTRELGDALTHRLIHHPLIDLRCNVHVRSAERRGGGFRLHLETPEGASTLDADEVVNCTWEDRDRIDQTVGVPHDSSLCYRVKHRAYVKLRAGMGNLAPVTMVQGPYGDVVPFRDGLVYISWYPECRTYFDAVPPVQDLHDEREAFAVAHRSLDVLSEMFPALRGAEVVTSSACPIVARGSTDVEDPASGLHERNRFGPREYDGWWTVDTGKLTTAPLNGETVAARITRETNCVVV